LTIFSGIQLLQTYKKKVILHKIKSLELEWMHKKMSVPENKQSEKSVFSALLPSKNA